MDFFNLLLITICGIVIVIPLMTEGKEHNYRDIVPFVVDKIWPRSNPSEMYNFYWVPGCAPNSDQSMVSNSLAHDISGSRRKNTKYDIRFGVKIDFQSVCPQRLYNEKEVNRFIEVIKREYYALAYYDDLPVKFRFGAMDQSKSRFFLNTHFNFKMLYNGKHIIEVVVEPDVRQRVELTKDTPKEIEFSYSATWVPTLKAHHTRFDKYIEMRLFPEEIEIQWFSIINSLVLVVILTAFLIIVILRILRRDFQYYIDEHDTHDSGWKSIHGDIFRLPTNVNLLSAIIGNGIQLLTLVFCILTLALVGAYYPDYSNRALYVSLIVTYTLGTGIAGFVSARYFKILGGERWVKNVFTSLMLFSLPTVIVWSLLNTIAIFYDSSAAFPFKSIFIIVALYSLVSFPLQLMGAITAKNLSTPLDPPCRAQRYERQIPQVPWYRGRFMQFLVAGFLPFSSIYIELYYIFQSLWSNIVYTPYPILFIVFTILILVTSCITIATIYVQVSQEDYRWWWHSIYCGASCSLFILGYSVFYFFFESQMHGILQFSFFFGYTFIAVLAFGFMMGAVGFLSSFSFLIKIYSSVKVD